MHRDCAYVLCVCVRVRGCVGACVRVHTYNIQCLTRAPAGTFHAWKTWLTNEKIKHRNERLIFVLAFSKCQKEPSPKGMRKLNKSINLILKPSTQTIAIKLPKLAFSCMSTRSAKQHHVQEMISLFACVNFRSTSFADTVFAGQWMQLRGENLQTYNVCKF